MGVIGLGWIVSAMRFKAGADIAMAVVAALYAPFSFWAGYKIVANALFTSEDDRKQGRRR
jgi:hypothetical protein